MADETPAVPAEAPQASESIADTSINTNQPVQTPAPASAPDMHGFASEELAKMRTFFDNSGGFEAVKSKISNPQPVAPAQPQTQAQPQAQPVQPQPQMATPPRGYASVQELAVERYFRDLASDPKYASISDQIQNGEVLKEMASMGMAPIDDNYNINVGQVNQFLALKAASVPTKPTSAEPNNTPTVDYVQVGENITDMNQALAVYDQSMKAQAKGFPVHPAFEQAKKYISSNWGKK